MNHETEIPLFCPVRTPEMEQAAVEVIHSGQIVSGPYVYKFEREFGQYIGHEHVVCTSDMTSALMLALKLAGVKPGDSVATIAYSCLSTTSAISMVGAKPVWIDVNINSVSMCPMDLERKLNFEVKAVVLYYIAGYPADTVEISSICKRRGVTLIEDCNNAIGAKIHGLSVGSFGKFSIYSFYPNRQINGLEGGALACPSEEYSQIAKRLRRFGIDYTRFRDSRGEINPAVDIPEIGLSASWSELNASVALSQLPTLLERSNAHVNNAMKLSELLKGTNGIKIVSVIPGTTGAYWCLLVLVEERDKILAKLKAKKISCSILHHRNDVYSGFDCISDTLPGTTYIMEHILALPCGWWLSFDEIYRVANVLKIECEK